MRSHIAAIILVSFILATTYISALISYFSPHIKITSSLLLFSSLFNLFLFGGAGVLAAYLIQGSFNKAFFFLGFKKSGFKKGVVYGAISSLVFLFLLSIFVSITGYKEKNELAEEIASSLNLFLLILIPLSSSLGEEIFFRGFIFSYLNKKFGWIASTLITSLLFSLAHLEYKALIEIIATFIFSIVLCYLIKSTQNIISSITAHFLYNFVSLLLFYIK